MLRPRIIPCLLLKDGGLVKTVKFASPKYVGDPLNAVRIFNEKEVDELFVLDIDATVRGREPNYGLVKSLAAECRMPLCYGGGVKTVDQCHKLISLGVEKVALSSAAIENPQLVSEASSKLGSQSVGVVIDFRKAGDSHFSFTHNGTRATGRHAVEVAQEMEACGAGEIVLNNIDRDGTMSGYDTPLISQVRAATSLPMTVIGGAGKLQDIADLMATFGLIGAAAGSLFVFKGPYRAVLINYPSTPDKDALIRETSLRSGQPC